MLIRVRYAPSPTGYQHIGGVRTALVNYLFARSQGGSFIVRIEDTDLQRCKEEYRADIFDSLTWLGIQADEFEDHGPHAPYVQSKRAQHYVDLAEHLVEQGHAYYCFTSSLDRSTEYDRSSRDLSKEQIAEHMRKASEGGPKPVVRLKLPLEGELTFEDRLLGTITRKFEDMAVDPILLKSDTMPTYHLANVADDHAMQVGQVLRSQEWIASTPLHLFLYKVLGWEAPEFWHLPMVLGDDGQKLSKRNGSLSVRELREQGILPEALVNYTALLGWSFDDSREFFTIDELIDCFQKGRIQKSPAKFSMQKLCWFNAQYIRQYDNETLGDLLHPILSKAYGEAAVQQRAAVLKNIPHIKERMTMLSDSVELLRPLFFAPDPVKSLALIQEAQYSAQHRGLQLILDLLRENVFQDAKELEDQIRLKAKEQQLSLGKILMPLRIAITGSTVSPPILPMLLSLSTEEQSRRIQGLLDEITEQLEVQGGRNT